MKVCPVCGTVFQGSETFCPHDGARLFTTSTEVGAWKDKALDDVVKLDHLLFVDELGERYLGTLIGQDVRVKVTLFNMVVQPDTAKFKALSMTQAIMEEPLPRQLAQVIAVNDTHDPPYLIEHAPAGPTLRQLLNEREHLDWPTAIKITNNLSRIIEWLSELGIVHRALHPHAIHITDIQAGTVALSEWAHGVLHYKSNALEAARNGEVVIYNSYVAPEQTDDASRADSRSMIYSAGMLLYEMLAGVPPYFGQEAEDILKRHRRERPTKLSISSQDKTLGTNLDELFELISNRLPEERFQTPLAMINALGTVLEEDETFPELTRDGTTITLDASNTEVDDASSSTLLFVDAEELKKTKNARQAEADAITKAAQKEQDEQQAQEQPAPPRRKKKKRRRKSPAESEASNTETKKEASTEIKGETSTSDKPSTPEVDDASAPTEQMDTSVLEEDKRDPSVVTVDDPEDTKSKASKEGSSKIIISEELSEPQEHSSAISGSSETTEEVEDASGETIVITPDTSRPRKKKRRKRPRPAQTKKQSEPVEKDQSASSITSKETSDAEDKDTKDKNTKSESQTEDTAENKTPENTSSSKKKRRRKRPASKETPAAKTPEKDQPSTKKENDSNSQDSAAPPPKRINPRPPPNPQHPRCPQQRPHRAKKISKHGLPPRRTMHGIKATWKNTANAQRRNTKASSWVR